MTAADALSSVMTRRFARVRTVVEGSVEASRLEQAHAPQSERAALLSKALQTLSTPY